jgi:hypothetical protein
VRRALKIETISGWPDAGFGVRSFVATSLIASVVAGPRASVIIAMASAMAAILVSLVLRTTLHTFIFLRRRHGDWRLLGKNTMGR